VRERALALFVGKRKDARRVELETIDRGVGSSRRL
jgi:hypothetical protein